MTITQGSKKTTSLFSISFVGLFSIEESLVFRSNFTAAAIFQIILSFLSVLLSLNSQGEEGDSNPTTATILQLILSASGTSMIIWIFNVVQEPNHTFPGFFSLLAPFLFPSGFLIVTGRFSLFCYFALKVTLVAPFVLFLFSYLDMITKVCVYVYV